MCWILSYRLQVKREEASDPLNGHRIRRMDAKTGMIVLTGNGESGYGGDGSPALG